MSTLSPHRTERPRSTSCSHERQRFVTRRHTNAGDTGGCAAHGDRPGRVGERGDANGHREWGADRGFVCGAPTSTSRNEREEWSHRRCDRTFDRTWGDSSALELESLQGTGRVMPNECWQRWESPLVQSEAEAHAVLQASIEQGPLRRDPRGTFRARGDSTGPARRHETPRPTPQRASAMGSSVETNRRSRGFAGTFAHPIEHTTNVAPFGVSAVTRLAHVNGALESSAGHTYEVQETDGVDPSQLRVSQATVGDGCPGDDTMNRLRVAAHEVMDGPLNTSPRLREDSNHHVSRVTHARGGTGLPGFGGR